MKIVFLNIWGGKMYTPLMAFLAAATPDTDFFCLQEIFDSPEKDRTVSWGGRADILNDLCATMPDFMSYYVVAVENFDGNVAVDFPLSHGIAIFTKKNITIASHGDFFIAGEKWHGPGTSKIFPHKLQYVRFEKDGRPYTVAHLHGIAVPGSKRDTPERIRQSQKIVEFLKGERGEKILGGDFNLLPDTESIRMIERAGMRNLIREHGITTTRNALSYGQYPETDRQYFADYVFVSSGVEVESFAAPQIEVSDHLPLIVELQTSQDAV